ncbi:MAG: hypothetical protein LJE58_15005, partial [Thiogranum sp.]|nr:hypothetical protein [Thiogranum sp.]
MLIPGSPSDAARPGMTDNTATPASRIQRGAVRDRLFRGATVLSGATVFGLVLGILTALAVGASLALQKFGAGFLTS